MGVTGFAPGVATSGDIRSCHFAVRPTLPAQWRGSLSSARSLGTWLTGRTGASRALYQIATSRKGSNCAFRVRAQETEQSSSSPTSEKAATDAGKKPGESSGNGAVVASQTPSGIIEWGQIAGWLFLAGFGLGAPIDGLHSLVGLQVYDTGAIVIGPQVDGLITNIWVFPLLGVMYVVVGLLQLLLDRTFPPPADIPAAKGSLPQMLTSLGVLVGLLRLSSLMFENELEPFAILEVLAVCGYANWYCFDRTLPGLLLGLFVATCAPASEVIFIKLGLWHYTKPDIYVFGEGLVSWTGCCYFFYTQWVAAVARALREVISPPPGVDPLEKNKLY